jgi:hypothetical protein
MSVLITMLLGWVALTGALAYLNLLIDISQRPPAIVWLIAVSFILATTIALSPIGRSLAQSLPIAWLIGFQSFRIVVELLLHQGYLAGLVPPQMTWEGRNWDILTGVSALPLAYLAYQGTLPRWAAVLWNILGFALLINVMTIAFLSAPAFVRQFPYIWLPTVLVPTAWVGHLVLFRRLQA